MLLKMDRLSILRESSTVGCFLAIKVVFTAAINIVQVMRLLKIPEREIGPYGR